MNLLDALAGLGTVLDTPGAMLRTGLAGENPLEAVFDTDKRISGRELLERYGLVGENEDQGWIPDAGDLGGFAAEMVLDPTNLIGGGLLAKLMGKAGKAKAANRAISSLNETAHVPTVRLFRGHGAQETADDVGKWWTAHPQYANRYGDGQNVMTTEVTRDWLAKNAKDATQDEFPNWLFQTQPENVRSLTTKELEAIQGPIKQSRFGGNLQKIEPDYEAVVTRAFPDAPSILLEEMPVPNPKSLLALLAGHNALARPDYEGGEE